MIEQHTKIVSHGTGICRIVQNGQLLRVDKKPADPEGV